MKVQNTRKSGIISRAPSFVKNKTWKVERNAFILNLLLEGLSPNQVSRQVTLKFKEKDWISPQGVDALRARYLEKWKGEIK